LPNGDQKKKRLQIVQNIILEKNSIKVCNILRKKKVEIAYERAFPIRMFG
jgi:hypothetical protein